MILDTGKVEKMVSGNSGKADLSPRILNGHPSENERFKPYRVRKKADV